MTISNLSWIGGTDITCENNVSLLGININLMHKSFLVKNLHSVLIRLIVWRASSICRPHGHLKKY